MGTATVVAAALVVAAGRPHVYTVSAGLAVVVFTWPAVRAWRRRSQVQDLATTTCRGVVLGPNEVKGTVQPIHGTLTSPFTSTPCVWFEWHVETWASGKGGGRWVTLERRATASPFWLEDETGRVLVRPRGGDIDGSRRLCDRLDEVDVPAYSLWELRRRTLDGEDVVERARSLADPDHQDPPKARSFASTGTSEPITELGRGGRITEQVLTPGKAVYLLGEGRPRQDADGIELGSSKPGDLLITTETEQDLVDRKRGHVTGDGLFAVAATALFGLLLSASVTGEYRPSWAVAMVGAASVVVAVLAAVQARRRLVAVSGQAAEAWSMLGEALGRQAALLAELAAAAETHVRREVGVQAAVGRARVAAGHRPLPTQVPPDAAAVAAAVAAHRDLRDGTAAVLALADAHPALAADEAFTDLRVRITDAGVAAASARAFHDDALALVEDRRTRFPGRLLILLVPVPSWPPLGPVDVAAPEGTDLRR